MELSGPKIKTVLIFSEKQIFLIFQEMDLSSPKLKKLLYFRSELKSVQHKNICYTFSYFLKSNFIHFSS